MFELANEIWHRPSRERCSEWDIAYKWFHEIDVPPELKYDLSFDEAKLRYPESLEESSKKDSKAQWIFGVALPSTAATFAVMGSWGLSFWTVLPTIVLLFLSMVFAVRTVSPAERPTPLQICDAMRMEQNERNPQAMLTASYHVAIVGMKAINRWKSLNARVAVYLLIFAAISFAIPVYYHVQPSDSRAYGQTQAGQSARDEHNSGRAMEPEEKGQDLEEVEEFPLRAPKPRG